MNGRGRVSCFRQLSSNLSSWSVFFKKSSDLLLWHQQSKSLSFPMHCPLLTFKFSTLSWTTSVHSLNCSNVSGWVVKFSICIILIDQWVYINTQVTYKWSFSVNFCEKQSLHKILKYYYHFQTSQSSCEKSATSW